MCSYSGTGLMIHVDLHFEGQRFISKLFIYLLICSFDCMYLLHLFVYLFD